jgi:hypothetical protein
MNTLRLCFDRSGSGPVTARRVAANKLCELRGTRAGPYRFSCVFTEWAWLSIQIRKGPYFNVGSIMPSDTTSKPPAYPTHPLPRVTQVGNGVLCWRLPRRAASAPPGTRTTR